MLKALKTAGDTIVEVLIAITVVSVILTGAYTVSNHSLKNTRQAQEHGEALKLAQSQVELIKVVSNTSTSTTLFATTVPFCIDSSSLNIVTLLANCKFGTNNLYQITTARAFVGGGHVFTVTANWPSAVGTGNDQVVLRYRIDN